MTAVLLLVLAAGLLVVGAELLVENAAATARRLGVSVLAVAVLLAGAEPEELVTAALAALRDRPGLAAGDALGANLTMLTAALGLAALVRPLPVGPRVRRYAVGAAVAGALAVLALLDGRVGRVEGLLLVLAYAGGVVAVWRRERTPPAIGELAEIGDDDDRSPAVAGLLLLVGLALLTAGGAAAVEGATRAVAALDVTDEAVGLVVLGLVTTVELFALVLAAARHGVEEIAVAAVVGSAAYNATATLGAAAVVAPLRVDGLLVPAVVAAALPLAVVVLGRSGRLGRGAGAVLALAYAVFGVAVLG